MKKLILVTTIVFLLNAFTHYPAFALDKDNVGININTPQITLPDYAKNECPICEDDYEWMGDKGCCLMSLENKTSSNIDFQFTCIQPDNIKCGFQEICIPGEKCEIKKQTSSFNPSILCSKLTVVNEQQKCLNCMNDEKHVWTSMGCVPIELGALISTYFFSILAGIGGVTSFLVFLYGSFLIITSSGEIERLNKGKQYISSAIKGILLITFSVLILKIIGVTILRIPGFS